MPLLRIQTNLATDADRRRVLLAAASRAVAETTRKSEEYVMVVMDPAAVILFAGDDAPAAFLELRGIGLGEDLTGRLSRVLAELLEEHLGVPRSRIYVNFADVPRRMWGWNAGTF